MIYLASPFTHEHRWVREDRAVKVTRLTRHLILDMGMAVFSPVAYTAAFEDAPIPFEPWAPFNDSMIRLCSQFWIYILPGWIDSRGVAHETELAKHYCKPISFVGYENNQLKLIPADKP